MSARRAQICVQRSGRMEATDRKLRTKIEWSPVKVFVCKSCEDVPLELETLLNSLDWTELDATRRPTDQCLTALGARMIKDYSSDVAIKPP